MTLCASLYNQLELTTAEASEMAGIDSFINEFNPEMMMMSDDGCLDYLDMSEIFSFGDEYKTSSVDTCLGMHGKCEVGDDHEHELLQRKHGDRFDVHKNQHLKQNLHQRVDNLHTHLEMQQDESDNEEIKQESVIEQQLNDQNKSKQQHSNLSQRQLDHQCTYIQDYNQVFIKTEGDSNASTKKHHIKEPHHTTPHHDTHVKEHSFQQEHELFPFLSKESHYNDDMENDRSTDEKAHLVSIVNKRNDINLENKMIYFSEDNVDVLARMNTVCRQQNLQINPYNWSVDEVNRWIWWINSKSAENTNKNGINDEKNENKNDLFDQLNNKIVIKNEFDNKLTINSIIASDSLSSSTPSTNTSSLTSNDDNFNDYQNNNYKTLGCKNYNFTGSYFCNLSQESVMSIFPDQGENLFVELEIWKQGCCLLENIESTDYKDDGVFAASFDTPSMCCDNDQQAFFNNIFQAFPSSHQVGSLSGYVNSDTFPKHSVRPNTLSFFTNPQLSTSADPVLSQPSFFLSPSNHDLNDYNSPNNIPDFFFPPCLEMSANSFSPPSSASPSSIHSDAYDPSYVPTNEPQPESCVQSTRQGNQLWQFLKELLHQPKHYETCIRWMDRQKGIFKIEDSIRVAKLWGERKNRPAMNYDKLSRSIRQYYKKGIIKKTTQSKRLVYQFCQRYL